MDNPYNGEVKIQDPDLQAATKNLPEMHPDLRTPGAPLEPPSESPPDTGGDPSSPPPELAMRGADVMKWPEVHPLRLEHTAQLNRIRQAQIRLTDLRMQEDQLRAERETLEVAVRLETSAFNARAQVFEALTKR